MIPLYQVIEAYEAYDKALQERFDLTVPQFRVLRVVDSLGGAPMGKLCEEAGLSCSTMTAAVDLLERKGWVRRVRSAADRRIINVTLTDEAAYVKWIQVLWLVETMEERPLATA